MDYWSCGRGLLVVAPLLVLGGCRAEFRIGARDDSSARRVAAERRAWLASWADVVAEEPDPARVADERARRWIAREGLPWLVRDRGLGIELVLVPAGGFEEEVGDANGGASDSLSDGEARRAPTTRRVAIDTAFYLGRCEVSQEEWARAMDEDPSEFRDDPRMPVDSVAWNLLVDPAGGFLQAIGFDLPTEAEWEWAARGPDARIYPWGSVADERLANFIDEDDTAGNYVLRTTPVGSYVGGASWCGALDMAGNVHEWCRAGESADAGTGVLRGGAWYSGTEDIRTTARASTAEGYANNGFGFRVVRRIPSGP